MDQLKQVLIEINQRMFIKALYRNSETYLDFFIIMATIYTIRGTNTPHVFLHDMFRPDRAIFRYIWGLQSPFSVMILSPTLASVYTLGVHDMCQCAPSGRNMS
jgi:hypothetical protein